MVLRFINKVVGMFMLIYVLGIVFMFLLLVFVDSGDLFFVDMFGLIVEFVDSDELMNWFVIFMVYVIILLGKILFFVGIGVLVIINLFVFYYVIDKVK